MPNIKLNFPKPYNVFNKQIFDNLFDYSYFIEVWYWHTVVPVLVNLMALFRRLFWKHWDIGIIPAKYYGSGKSIEQFKTQSLPMWLIACQHGNFCHYAEWINQTVLFIYRMVRFSCSRGWMIQKRSSRSRACLMWSWRKHPNLIKMISHN